MYRTQEQYSRDTVFSMLRDLKVSEVIVDFYGGGDEGSVDKIVFEYSDEREPETFSERYGASIWDQTTRSYKYSEKATEQDKLIDALCQPVYDNYGTFAGDFHVDGRMVWNVEQETVQEQSHVEVPSTEYIEESR